MNSTEKWRAYYSPVGRIRMLAGNPALDLANTFHWRKFEWVDFLPDYLSLVGWSVCAQLLKESEAHELRRVAEKHPSEAADVLQQWKNLRTALKSWLYKIDGLEPLERNNAVDLDETTQLFAKISSLTANVQLDEYFAIEMRANKSPDISLPLLRGAFEIWRLVELPPNAIIRQCQADQCGGFFLDESRAKPRRWCSMDSCGNRAKATRHRTTNQKIIPI